MENKSVIALFLFSIYFFSACGNYISDKSELCKIVINGHEIVVQHSLGGAVSSDYLVVLIDENNCGMWKVAGDVSIKNVSVGDSLMVSFADSVYFVDQRKYSQVIALTLKWL